MDRSDIKSTITFSNPNFYKKIIQKYQTGKKDISIFPGMVLHKERGHTILQKISLILKFRFHLDKQNILPFLILKKISLKGMFPKLNTEKNTHQSLVKPKNAQDIGNITNIFKTSLKILHMYQVASGLFSSEYASMNRVPVISSLRPLCLISSDIATANSRISKYRKIENFSSIILKREINNNWSNTDSDFTFIDNENNPGHQLVFEHKSPSFYLDKRAKEFFLVAKDIPALKGMLSRFNTKKHALQSIVKIKNTISISEVINLFSTKPKIPQMYQVKSGFFPAGHLSASRTLLIPFLKSLIFRDENVKTESNKILKSPILALKAAIYQQTTNPIYPNRLLVSSQLLNYENNMEILNSHIFKEKINRRSLNLERHSTFISEKSLLKNLPLFWNKVPGILLQDNLLFDNTNPTLNRHFFKKPALGTVSTHFIKSYHASFEHNGSSPVQNTYAYKTGSKSLFFQDQGRMEQEIEKIKKIVIETKESVLKKPVPAIGEADIKRCLDINRISDQVYQNIERTIRMERERRGI